MSMLEKLVLPEIRELIDVKDLETLREILSEWLPPDVAALISDLEPDEQATVFRTLEMSAAAAAFGYLDFGVQEQLTESLPVGEFVKVLNGMAPDDRTRFLEDLPPDRMHRLLSLLAPEERKVAQSLLAYPEDSVGRLMTPDYIAVREHWTVEHVLDFVRTYGKDSETLNAIYVTDEKGHLIDDIRMREVLLASPHATVRDLMDRTFLCLTRDGFEGKRGRAVSQVRSHGAAGGERRGHSGRHRHGRRRAGRGRGTGHQGNAAIGRRRGPGRAVHRHAAVDHGPQTGHLAGDPVPGRTVDHDRRWVTSKKETRARRSCWCSFIPLIISSGGNSGSQAATLIVRALALGEVGMPPVGPSAARESGLGIAAGTDPGLDWLSADRDLERVFRYVRPHWMLDRLDRFDVAVIGVVLWGTITGSMLPLLLKRIGLDPATSSAPFVATLVDVTGLVIYFTAALAFLSGTLL